MNSTANRMKAGAHLHFVHSTNAQCLAAETVGSDECEKNGISFWSEIQMGKEGVDRITTFDDWKGGQKEAECYNRKIQVGEQSFSQNDCSDGSWNMWVATSCQFDCYLRQPTPDLFLSKLQI